MRLELGTFPVRSIAFGETTRWADGRLTVDRAAALAEVRRDVRIASAALEIAAPGESARIWPVRDVIEKDARHEMHPPLSRRRHHIHAGGNVRSTRP